MDELRVRSFVVGGLLAMTMAACSGGDAEPTPAATATVTVALPTSTQTVPSPTATPSVEEEVLVAYLDYWDLYAVAVLNLDASVLTGAASEAELRQVQDEIEGFRAEGLALRVVIEHRPVVIESTENTAVVFDEMTNNSFYVAAETLEPSEGTGSGETLVDTFFLKKVDGRWIVDGSIRQN